MQSGKPYTVYVYGISMTKMTNDEIDKNINGNLGRIGVNKPKTHRQNKNKRKYRMKLTIIIQT